VRSPEREISRKDVSPMNTITQPPAQNDDVNDGRPAVASVARGALRHNHVGWPGIQPTSSSCGAGDILYWTTPGAFRYGPIERTPESGTTRSFPAGAGAAFSGYVVNAMRVLSAESSARARDAAEGSIAA
jgi:hypothetical protein